MVTFRRKVDNIGVMATRGYELRKHKFVEMTADLATVLAGKSNAILCPLCLGEFGLADIGSIDGSIGPRLTIEHVIPASVGGTAYTLTCKKCNSAAGSEIDSHFARKFRIEKALAGGGEISARLKGKGIGAPAFLTVSSQGFRCRLEPTTSPMAALLKERFGQYEKGEHELSLSLDTNVDVLKLSASMVKTAYLGLFIDWGYKYAVLPMLDWVRKGIREPGEERESFLETVVSGRITEFPGLEKEPTRMSFDAVCAGVKVSCSVINGVLGEDAFWVLLPPISDLSSGSRAGLIRAAQSIRGKSLQITFTPEGLANIQESA
jgi:HNH endonuclease